MMHHLRPVLVIACMLISMLCSSAASGRQEAEAAPKFTDAELDQLLASIALYPDSLLSQVFMASTYPLEVVQADRWVKRNTSLKGEAMEKALEEQTWDASVRSLVNFPDVLGMMSENLDMTTKLGDAFIAQQDDVMKSVQRLRAAAKAEGNLADCDQQTVVVEESGGTQIIMIESPSPTIVYVPTYNPTVVYGVWRYPAYPPYPYYPPAYRPAGTVVAFGAGVALGAAWGYAWGNCNWRHGDIDINVNRNTNFNSNINRNTNINTNINRNTANVNAGNRAGGQGGSWQHDGAHRQGVSYRDQSTSQKFGQGSSRDVSKARESYRGRADAGARDLNQGGAGSPGSRDTTGRAGAGTSRDRGSSGQLGGGAARDQGSRGRQGSSALGGSNRSGQSTRNASSRGRTSRSGSAGGGGGSRGGGGRGGGGRR